MKILSRDEYGLKCDYAYKIAKNLNYKANSIEFNELYLQIFLDTNCIDRMINDLIVSLFMDIYHNDNNDLSSKLLSKYHDCAEHAMIIPKELRGAM